MSEEPTKRRGNPQMAKGAPSLNPSGKPKTAPGSDGVVTIGGFLGSSEKKPSLIGPNKWVTQDNMVANIAAVASAVRIWLDLLGSMKWTLKENPAGGVDARRCAELVHDGLIARRMTKPWRSVVRKQGMKKFRGFAMHAKGTVRDSQGRIVFSELAHRPPWSITKWFRPDETVPWTGVEQQTRLGQIYNIDRGDLFYSVEDAIADSFEGLGLFRHLADVADIFATYRRLQGIGFESDINGTPIARVPLSELVQQAINVAKIPATDTAKISAYVANATKEIRDLIENRTVTPDRSLTLDSLPYFGTDIDGSKRPSQVYKWAIETVRAQITAIPELRAALGDLNREILRVMCAEWLAMGDSEGARSVHGDKTKMFALVVNACADDITDDANRDLVWWLVARNGYDPERCAPTLQHEPLHMEAAIEAARMLAELAKAKLKPDDEAIAILRERCDLPAPPEPTDEEIEASRRVAPAPSDKENGEEVPEPTDDDKGKK